MKTYQRFFILATFASKVFSFSPIPTLLPRNSALNAKELMSEIDIMCISNAADLCSYYENCDIEEREALLNRFAEQTDIMAERMATMQSLVNHLETGDHKFLDEKEVEALKNNILSITKVTEEHHP